MRTTRKVTYSSQDPKTPRAQAVPQKKLIRPPASAAKKSGTAAASREETNK